MNEYNVIRKIYRDIDVKNVEAKLKFIRNPRLNAIDFMNLRLIITLIVFTGVMLFSDLGYLEAPIAGVVTYFIINYIFIGKPIKDRIQKLDNEALTFFEVFTLSLESGKNLENALETTVQNVDSELSDEFKKVLLELKFGKSLDESLDNLKKRIPSESINNIILNMNQTSIFGNRIIETMNNQVNFLREKKLLNAKGRISKLPNQISVISVLFIVPLILCLVLGPFFINYFLK